MGREEDVSELTKSERAELGQAVRLHARVARARLDARKAELVADFEEQLAAEYQFDDARWDEITRGAKEAVSEADAKVAAVCAAVGIPAEFRPKLRISWYERGESGIADRRAELHQVAKTRIDAMVKAARAEIDAEEARKRVDLIARGLTSEEGRAFLDDLPTIEDLMPRLDLKELDTPAVTDEMDDLDF
jgi:hypothetical protein